jgi:TIR domain
MRAWPDPAQGGKRRSRQCGDRYAVLTVDAHRRKAQVRAPQSHCRVVGYADVPQGPLGGHHQRATGGVTVSVFISYTSADKQIARHMADALEAHGVSVWIDETSLPAGSRIAAYLHQAIEESDVFLILLSKASVRSTWMQMETSAFLAKSNDSNARILTVVLDEDAKKNLPPLLRSFVYYDLSKSANLDEDVNRLVKVITSLPPRSQSVNGELDAERKMVLEAERGLELERIQYDVRSAQKRAEVLIRITTVAAGLGALIALGWVVAGPDDGTQTLFLSLTVLTQASVIIFSGFAVRKNRRLAASSVSKLTRLLTLLGNVDGVDNSRG